MTTSRDDRIRAALGWCLPLVIVIMQTFNLRKGLFTTRDDLLSWDLVLYAGITLVCLPWTLRTVRDITRLGRWLLYVFMALLAYAFVSSLVTLAPTILGMRIDRAYLVMPNVAAFLALLAGVSIVAVMPARLRAAQLWWGAAVLVVTSYATWPAQTDLQGSVRFSTSMGGAAVIYIALLITAAIFIGAAFAGVHRWVSVIGAALSVAAILFSGSRAGLICFAIFVAILVVGQFRRGRIPRVLWWALGGVVAVLSVTMLVVPELRRMLSLDDPVRVTNLTAAMTAWGESWQTMLFGQGSGRVWPWYTFEARYFGGPPLLIDTPWGDVLVHPHSTFLVVLVELGLVGLVVWLAFVVLLVRGLLNAREQGKAVYLVMAAIVAGIPGFLFDTYLFKNLTIAFWWWAVLISVVGFGSLAKPTTEQDQFNAASAAS